VDDPWQFCGNITKFKKKKEKKALLFFDQSLDWGIAR